MKPESILHELHERYASLQSYQDEGVDVTPVYPLTIGFGLACPILIPMKIVRGCFQTNTEQAGPDNRHTAGV
jgi:hypothetical protein